METSEIKNQYEIWHSAIDDAKVNEWLSEDNLSKREKRTFAGFEIVSSLDGNEYPNVEVSLVRLNKEGKYPQHIHNNSDAYLIITEGSAVFLSGQEKTILNKGDRKDIPRGTPHGFELQSGEGLEFISVQCPPIKDEHTGEEDFHLVDLV
jgi:quercetin dioxygenase-like cupin family protein